MYTAVRAWAIKCRLVDPELTIARHRRGTSPKLSTSEQDAAVERVVYTDELSVRDRAAAILVIVFGQHIEDVVELSWDDVTVTDDVVTIRMGKTEFALPSPLDEPMRQLAAAPGNDLTASQPNSNWVFRGYSPGRHIQGSSLRSRLASVFSTRAARLGTLHELTKLGPVPIIADALGYHPSTIERHAIGSATMYSQYIAAKREMAQSIAWCSRGGCSLVPISGRLSLDVTACANGLRDRAFDNRRPIRGVQP